MYAVEFGLDKRVGLGLVAELGTEQFLGNLDAEVGNLVFQLVHGFQLLIVDILAGGLDNTVGFGGGAGLVHGLDDQEDHKGDEHKVDDGAQQSAKKKAEEEAKPEEPAGPTTEELLQKILDELQKKK